MVAVLVVLLFFFSQPIILWMLGILIALAVIMATLIHVDASKIELKLHTASGGRAGQSFLLNLSVHAKKQPLVTKYVVAELEIHSAMFGTTEKKRLILPLGRQHERFETDVMLNSCGEIQIRCVSAKVCDLMEIFHANISPFSEKRTIIYPNNIDVSLTVTNNAVGPSKAEGIMQNRRGNDPSEIFDIRDYNPGDDIRSIHWKLSSKTGTLVMREPSDPSHYDVVLLPDFGLFQNDKPVSQKEHNAAVALTISIGEQLIKSGVMFCFALPTKQGLSIIEVRSLTEFYDALPKWLSLHIQQKSGVGLQCFLADRLDQYFTRLIIVSSGSFSSEISGLDKRIGLTVVSSSDTDEAVYSSIGDNSQAVVVPSSSDGDKTYRIIC